MLKEGGFPEPVEEGNFGLDTQKVDECTGRN